VKANRAYHLIVTRGGVLPGPLAHPDRTDRIEIVEVATQEVILYWELPHRDAARLARRLRGDLAQMEAEDFIAAWGEE
jgi:hypothetical protein